MTKACAVCGNPAVWQGMVLGSWKHADASLDADHAAIYIAPTPRACCGREG